MADRKRQSIERRVWGLVRLQHGVVSRGQLKALGYSPSAIHHRVVGGRLHLVARGVFAVGRPELTRHGRWMAAVLSSGGGDVGGAAVLSHGSAAALFGFGAEGTGRIEVSVLGGARSHHGLRVHRRTRWRAGSVGVCDRIPVTSPVQTLIDLAARCDRMTVERMVDEADRLGLVSPPELREALAGHAGERGVGRLGTWLDRRTFCLTRSHLERLFLPLVAAVGLPVPETKAWVNGFEVDFLWRGPRLVVETDSLRHHRTPAAQSRDHRRDQVHTAAGFTAVRFTHEQVRYEPEHVRAVLTDVATRLGAFG